ncbi:helix-turn-helix domain-containing protein [Halalkalibacterium halodurans]|uniref:helix-turn-helix domain-containing protein n=1 Tax=Halalkalibacterium halodurans TaxID=86665 RepID=UPI002E248E1F|nr:helix-turn-helix domain-containing protein [Halalkalibacterium halodurans]
MDKTRSEKFARIFAIADRLSKHSFEPGSPTVEQRYRTEFSRNPVKFLGILHRDLIDRSHRWGEKEHLLFEILTEEIASLDIDEFTNEELEYDFSNSLSKAKVEMWNVIGVNDAAKILNLSPGTVKNKCASGEIPAKKVGTTWVMDKTKIER